MQRYENQQTSQYFCFENLYCISSTQLQDRSWIYSVLSRFREYRSKRTSIFHKRMSEILFLFTDYWIIGSESVQTQELAASKLSTMYHVWEIVFYYNFSKIIHWKFERSRKSNLSYASELIWKCPEFQDENVIASITLKVLLLSRFFSNCLTLCTSLSPVKSILTPEILVLVWIWQHIWTRVPLIKVAQIGTNLNS